MSRIPYHVWFPKRHCKSHGRKRFQTQSSVFNDAVSFQVAASELAHIRRRFSHRRSPPASGNTADEISVERNVRYSSHHPRNVLDIYSPKKYGADSYLPTLLFVHGGMWLRGSKEQHTLSMYGVASQLTRKAYRALWNQSVSSTNTETAANVTQGSNVGRCVAQHGGVACIMNYRLAAETTDRSGGSNTASNENSDDEQETGHPHQVMDVARAIAFLINKFQVDDGRSLHLFVGGHSAGAHLAALCFSDPTYLRMAMQERGLDNCLIQEVLRGFVGISGVYNLRRLAMSPLAPITIGPAFCRGRNGSPDDTLEASPVQVLLKAHESIQGDRISTSASDVPFLATVPILLLNAQRDFHLAQDTCVLLTAFEHFTASLADGKKELPARLSTTIPNRNHFSIMGEFGRGIEHESEISDTPLHEDGDADSWSAANTVYRMPGHVLAAASSFLSSYVTIDSAEGADETSTRLLQFMGLK